MSPEPDKVFGNKFFSVYGKRRATPNDFTKLGDAIEKLKKSIILAIGNNKILRWLEKFLSRFNKKI